MAKKQIQISIADPCTENWDMMTPKDKGKFCASCQKTVVDFSSMTDAEMIHYFENYKGATCGRFTEKQLSAPIIVSTINKPQRHWAWALSTLLLPTVVASQTVKRVESVSVVETALSVKIGKKVVENDLEKGKVENDTLKLQGIVMDTLNAPLVGASVVLKGTNIGAITDLDGFFKLEFSSQVIDDQLFELVVSYVGYESIVVRIMPSDADKPLRLKMIDDARTFGEYIVTSTPQHRTLGNLRVGIIETPIQRTKYFFKRLFRKK